MIRVRMSDGLFIMGVDAENIRRLKDGEPLNIDLRPLGGTDRVVIIYGDTLLEIARDLERATGAPLPPAQPWPDEPPENNPQ